MIAAQQAPEPVNQCTDPARHLICPNLVMTVPRRLVLRRTARGRTLLAMDNYLYNRGPGPVRIVGRRAGEYRMNVLQVIDRSGGRRPAVVRTGATLTWKYVDRSRGHYWKFRHAARFELWRLDARGVRIRLTALGPKQDYCLRDLFRFGRGLAVRPGPFFGACSQDFSARTDTLGISVGWADGYPYTYPQNHIDVTGLRGCFAVLHRADPLDGIHESDEADNMSHRVVRLPFRPGHQHCPRYRGRGTP